jgi:hypothetical protein
MQDCYYVIQDGVAEPRRENTVRESARFWSTHWGGITYAVRAEYSIPAETIVRCLARGESDHRFSILAQFTA